MKESFNWALVGTGGISNKFLSGLRSVAGAKAYAAVSRSMETARSWAVENGIEKAYADYDEMLADPAVDIVYIGTPHPTHKDYTVQALKAKKAVLCEKPFCMNEGEAREMIQAARDNKVFLMEAMWTRFVPPLRRVKQWLDEGRIGEVQTIQANFGYAAAREPEKRLLNPALGGGALLDTGIYPLALASFVFGGAAPVSVQANLHIGETGVDETTSALLDYGDGRLASILCSLRTTLVSDGWIYGTKGFIRIPHFVWAHEAELTVFGAERENIRYEPDFGANNGYGFEAAAVMDCVRQGKTECDIMSLDESFMLMRIMDEIRVQGKLRYPCE